MNGEDLISIKQFNELLHFLQFLYNRLKSLRNIFKTQLEIHVFT